MMIEPNEHSRVGTGLKGLDHILGGGLPRGSLHLVRGGPGTGKTTLGLQFLLEGAGRGETTMLVSLSETEQEIRAVADSHGWSLEGVRLYELSAAEKLLGLAPPQTVFHRSEVELAEVSGSLLRVLEEIQPERVVFDSVAEFRVLAEGPAAYRQQILLLKTFTDRSGCTMLLVDVWHPAGGVELATLANTVVELEQGVAAFEGARRRLRVLKTRGIPFRTGYHDFRLATGGLEVFPRLVAADHDPRRELEQIPTGLPELDELIGGGLYRGTSTLLLGPSGIGKTTVATRFAIGAAERGERAALYLFDERPATLYRRAEQLGMALHAHTDAGRIEVRPVSTADLTPGEFAQAIRERVEAGARMILIDSLNGYFRAMPTDNSVMQHLHDLVGYLNQRDVITIMVMGQHGLFETRSPEMDLSYLTDAVLLFRYFEYGGEVRKAISVFKSRGGDHERTIRELRFSRAGIALDRPLKEFHGVLTGKPVYEGGRIER